MCVDEGFATDTDDPSKPSDISSASSEVRQRAAKLYGLLAGLVKNRALSVRVAPAGGGFEALRQITLSMRPNTSQGEWLCYQVLQLGLCLQ
jgi:hypothetical protein